MTSWAMTCMSGALSTENMDSQGWQPQSAMHILGSRTSKAQISEAGTRNLLRQPQLSVSIPSVLDPYAKTCLDPGDHSGHHENQAEGSSVAPQLTP